MAIEKLEISVLYAEDEPEIRENTAELIGRRVKKLCVAENGAEALKLFEKESFDILITDIRMPEMDGLELISKVKQSGRNTRCLIISAFNDTDFLMQAIASGVEGYLLKPIIRQRLISEIERLAAIVINEKELEIRTKELKEAYQLLHNVINSPENVAVFVVGSNRKILSFNGHYSKLMADYRDLKIRQGMDIDKIYGSMHSDTLMLYGINQSFAGKHVQFEHLLGNTTGMNVFYHIKFQYIANSVNNTPAIAVFCTDVSEFKQKESELESRNLLLTNQKQMQSDALQGAEEKYIQLVENMNDGVLIVDSNGAVIQANSSFCRMSNYDLNNLINTHFFRLFLPDEHPTDDPFILYSQLSENLDTAIRGKLKQQSGSLLPVEVYSSKILSEGREFLVFIVRDFRIYNRILNERNHLFSSLNEIKDTVMITDPEGVVLFVNRAFEQNSGYPAESVINASFCVPELGFNENGLCAEIINRLRSGNIWTGHLNFRHNNGKILYESVTATPLFDTNDRIEFMLFVKHNITGKIVGEKNDANIRKLEALSSVMAGVTHDFNNILSAISINLELAMEDASASGQVQGSLANIRSDLNRAQLLVKNVFNYHPVAFKPSLTDLSELLSEIIEALRLQVSPTIQLKKQIGCKITYPVESLHVYQIVTNLVRNAAEAINGEGSVTVILNKVKSSFDSLLVDFEATEWVNIAVEDNGPGIEQSIADKVFEPFFTTKSEKNGSGLGLSVVLGLVSNYGGQVAFHTLHPHGTRFDIFLPVNNDIIIM